MLAFGRSCAPAAAAAAAVDPCQLISTRVHLHLPHSLLVLALLMHQQLQQRLA
jgi:hypothetical protein